MGKKEIIFALIAGITLALSFPKIEWSILAWVSLVPLLFAINEKKPVTSFILGFISGSVFFAILLYWLSYTMRTYGSMHPVLSYVILALLVAYLAFYIAVFCFFISFFNMKSKIYGIYIAPFLWVLLELVRTHFLTGFPWGLIGYSQYKILNIIQISDITGVYGVSFLIIFSNIVIFKIISTPVIIRSNLIQLFILAIMITTTIVYGNMKIHEEEYGNTVKAAVIQGNINQLFKWNKDYQNNTITIYSELTSKFMNSDINLIAWPETAAPFYFTSDFENRKKITELALKMNKFILLGAPDAIINRGKVNYYNSAFLINQNGEISGRYDKIHLVPFGEYVPFKKILFFVEKMAEGISDFSSGSTNEVFGFPGGKFGTVICYEVIFPDLFRRFVSNGAQFMVNITNDGWFGKTSGPYQHLTMVPFRAVENRVPIIRAANTGISAIVDKKGSILESLDLEKRGFITSQVRIGTNKTFYSTFGDIFAYLCTLFVILWTLLLKKI